MKTIFKYRLTQDDWQSIEMPGGAKVIAVQTHDGTLCLWAEVDLGSEPPEPRDFAVVNTRQMVPKKTKYVGTATNGPVESHVYERIR